MDIADLLVSMNNPEVITLRMLIDGAENRQRYEIASELRDRKTRRSIPHKLERAGYRLVRNPNAKDG